MPEPRKPRRYTRRQKATAVMAAEVTSLTAAAEAQGIPLSTLEGWMKDPRLAALRSKTREEMADDMKVLAAAAAQRILEVLPQFEPRDLVILLGVATDKGQLLGGQATSRTEHRELLNDFDDHERDAVAKWLRDIATAEVTVDAGE